MIRNLLFKEIHQLLVHSRYWVYAVLVVAVISGGFIHLSLDYQRKYDSYRFLNDSFTKETVENQFFSEAVRKGVSFALPPGPLQTFCLGTERLGTKILSLGSGVWYTDKLPLIRTEGTRNPLFDFIPVPDFTFIIIFFVSLMVLVFSYGAVASERESGTLKLVLANPVPRAAVIFCKLAGGFTAIILPVLFGLLLNVAINESMGWGVPGLKGIAIILVLFVYSSAYLLVIYLLTVLISVLCRTPAAAIAVVLLVWLVFIVVVHNVSLLFIQKGAAEDSVYGILQQHGREAPDVWDRIKDDIRSTYGEETLEKWKTAWYRREHAGSWFIQMDHVEEYRRGLVTGYRSVLAREYRLLRRVACISPSLLYKSMVTDLCGTGVAGYLDQMDAGLDQYRYLNDAIKKRHREREKEATFAFIANSGKPVFPEIRPVPVRDAVPADLISRTAGRFIVLLIYISVLFCGAVYAFLKTEID